MDKTKKCFLVRPFVEVQVWLSSNWTCNLDIIQSPCKTCELVTFKIYNKAQSQEVTGICNGKGWTRLHFQLTLERSDNSSMGGKREKWFSREAAKEVLIIFVDWKCMHSTWLHSLMWELSNLHGHDLSKNNSFMFVRSADRVCVMSTFYVAVQWSILCRRIIEFYAVE